MGFSLDDINLYKKAESFLKEKGAEFVDGAKEYYSNGIQMGTDLLKSVTPEGAHEAIGEISAGVTSLGRDAIDFLDPVSYGLDLLADGVAMLAPQHNVTKVLGVTNVLKGNKDAGLETLGKSMADEALLTAQGGLLMLPSGHTAGKAAGRALKKGLKSAKKEFKAVKSLPKDSPDRVLAQKQLTRQRQIFHGGKFAARVVGKAADQFARDALTNTRHELNFRSYGGDGPHVKQRDWSQFGKTHDPNVLGNDGPRVPKRKR